MKSLSGDIIALMKKRVYDLAGVISHKVRVRLNGRAVKVRGFNSYVDMYLGNNENTIKIRLNTRNNKRWDLIVSISEGEFQ